MLIFIISLVSTTSNSKESKIWNVYEVLFIQIDNLRLAFEGKREALLNVAYANLISKTVRAM